MQFLPENHLEKADSSFHQIYLLQILTLELGDNQYAIDRTRRGHSVGSLANIWPCGASGACAIILYCNSANFSQNVNCVTVVGIISADTSSRSLSFLSSAKTIKT